jgi:hypothetical protein
LDGNESNIGALYGALAKAQGAFAPIAKNRTVQITMKSGGKYAFRYADLEAIIAATRKGLSENGLAVFQTLTPIAEGRTVLKTIVAHSSGHSVASEITLPGIATIDDPKIFGAVMSYFRRYQLSGLLGVAADDDLDEGGGGDADPSVTALLQRARDASMEGSSAYIEFFMKTLTAKERAELKDYHKELKDGAAVADKRIAGEPS